MTVDYDKKDYKTRKLCSTCRWTNYLLILLVLHVYIITLGAVIYREAKKDKEDGQRSMVEGGRGR